MYQLLFKKATARAECCKTLNTQQREPIEEVFAFCAFYSHCSALMHPCDSQTVSEEFGEQNVHCV